MDGYCSGSPSFHSKPSSQAYFHLLYTEGKDHFPQSHRGGHRGNLGWIVVRCQLYDIKSNDMKVLKLFEKGEEFMEGEAPGFWRSNPREEAGINHIEIEGDIDGLVFKAPHQ